MEEELIGGRMECHKIGDVDFLTQCRFGFLEGIVLFYLVCL